MTARPPLLQIPGRHPSLLVPPADDAKVLFYLRGMGIKFRRCAAANGQTRFELPNMQPSAVTQIIDALMRDSLWHG